MDQSPLASGREALETKLFPLEEERVRHQLGAAEELHHLGHSEPTLVAAGAALAGALRLHAAFLTDSSASCGAVLEAMRAAGVLSDPEHETLCRLLHVYGRLTRGYAPDRDAALDTCETECALATIVHMLEPQPDGSDGAPPASDDRPRDP